MSRRWTVAALVGITLFALLLRLVYFQGFVGKDDESYIYSAHLLAQGRFVPSNNEWDVRIGIIAPIALAIQIFGLHDWSVTLYPLCLSLLSITLIYFLGKTFFCWQVGLIASLLLACFPQDIYYSTLAYSVLPSVFYAALAILLVYYTAIPTTRPARLSLAFTSGLALGITYLTFEGQLIFAVVCLLAIRIDRAVDKLLRLSLVVAPPVCVVAIEALVYWHLTGNLLFRFTALHSHTSRLHSISLLHYLIQWPVVLLNPAYPQTFLYVLLAIWAVAMTRKRLLHMQDGLLLVWLLGSLVFFTFAVISVRPLVPLLEVEPYILHGLAYPAILLAAQAIYATYPRSINNRQGYR